MTNEKNQLMPSSSCNHQVPKLKIPALSPRAGTRVRELLQKQLAEPFMSEPEQNIEADLNEVLDKAKEQS